MIAPWRAERGSELARLRIDAHREFDRQWKYFGLSRKEAYKRLSEKLGVSREDCHMACFNEDQCRKVIEISMEGL